MNQTLKRTLALLMIFCLMIGFVPVEGMRDLIPQASAESGQDAVRNAEIPKAFSLPDSPLGVEHSSGPWRYALRMSDGYALITGYDGTETELAIPQELDGIDVVGLTSKALPQAEHVTLHTNIFYLAEDCFGKDLREITAPNGSLGLYWASTHDVTYNTGKDYDLVPGVIDYTGALPGRIQKRGESHVVFSKLESLPLQVGSLFFMRDARDMEFFFRVLELTEQGDSVIATVEIPEVADAIINYQTTVAVDLTADDFIPADGVTVVESPASEKTISTTRNNKETTLEIGPFGALKETGRNDSTKVSVDISGKVVSKNTVIYTVNIENGVFTATEYSQEQTLETSVTISAKAEENLLEEYGKAQETLKKLSEGKSVSEEEKSKLKAIAGRSFEDASGNSMGVSAADIAKASSQIEKMTEAVTSGKPTGGTWECGSYTLQTPYFNVSVSVSINVSVSGSITYSNSHTNVTKNVYNFDTDEWETVYSNGNASEGKDGQSIVAQIKGTVGLEVEVAVGAFFVKNFSFKLELGVEFSASKKFGNGNTLAFLNCTIFTIKPYMEIKVYLGIWVGKSTGFKHEIYNKEWTLQELTGREYLWQAHINIALSENKVHSADDCPLDSAKTVSYDTKTGLQVQKKTVFVGKPLTGEFNVDLNQYAEVKAADWKAGTFLGWAWNETDIEPTAAKPGEAFKNSDGMTGDVFLTQNVTLYAVWSQMFTVHFNSNGGTEIPDQSVPSGGYITKPQNPTKEFGIFVGWRDGNGKYWDFERDTVKGNMTLTADWGDGEAPTPGMLNAAYIGEYDDVSADCKYNPNSLISSGVLIPAHYLTYELVKDQNENPAGLIITGVKNNPERLIIPKTLPYGNDEKGLEVIDIKIDAFRDCTSIRSVYFLTDDDKRFTPRAFSGCINLEYIELPALENGRIGISMFAGCNSLKCVKARAGTSSIGDYAFFNTAIGSCIINGGITSIGFRAFNECKLLTKVDLREVNTIDSQAFYGCPELHEVFLYNVYNVNASCFQDCDHLTKVTLDGVKSLSANAFCGCESLKKLDMENIESIGKRAFLGCKLLETLYIPDTVKELGVDDYDYIGPFYGCSGLKQISIGGVETITKGMLWTNSTILEKLTIRGSVTKIDHEALSGQYDDLTVRSILEIENGVKTIGRGAFSNCDFSTVIIPESVYSIGPYAFNQCSKLYEISISAYNILDHAFFECRNLSKVSLKNVNTISESAFASCTQLKELDLGTVETIFAYAFADCVSLEELYIPDSVKQINVMPTYPYFIGPFVGCTGLKRISIGGVEKIISGMLKTGSQDLEQLVIRGTVRNIDEAAISSMDGYVIDDGDSYKNGRYGNGYSFNGNAKLIIEDGVKTIGNRAFENCDIFSSIIIPESVESIGYSAFFDCDGIREINLPSQIQTVVDNTFQECDKLEKVSMSNVRNIGYAAFSGCKNLKQIDLDSVETISERAFADCTGIYEINLKAVESISPYAFQNCSSLEKLYIPDTARQISSFGGKGKYIVEPSFMGCTSLKEISVGGIESLENGMLKTGSEVLQKLTIRGTVGSIGENAFDSENGYLIEYSYDAFGNGYAFEGHAELVIEDGVKTIGNYAFRNCRMFSSIKIPESVTFIGDYAFSNCDTFTDMFISGTNMPFANTSLNGRNNLTIHILDENPLMVQYCKTHSIPYDTVSSFSYILTLNLNRNGKNDKDIQTLNWLDELELPIPTWKGHVFSGWYRDANCTSTYTGKSMPNYDLTLYAGWDIDIYTLTLNLLGGEAAKTKYRVHASDEVEVNIPTKSGCCFLGWAIDEAGKHAFNGTMPAENTTLYALWQAESVNGRYKNDGDHMILIGYDQIEEEGTAVYLPETVDGLPLTQIAAGAFANSDVKTLYIPASVTNIEPGAFYQSKSLTNLYVAENNPTYSSKSGVIYNKDGTAILFFPPVGRYRVYLSENVQRIGERAFDGTLLESIDLPESVDEIGARAFRNTAITELTLPASIETIGERAFTGCRDLALVEALGSPENVDSTAFSGCNGFLLAYGPDEDCAFRRVMRNNGYLYNAFTLTMVQPTRTTTAFLQAGAEMLLPESPAVPENRAFTGWYLDKAFTEPLIDTTMPAHELTIYAGTVQVFDYTTITDEETQASRLRITACHALGDSVEIPESIGGVPVTKLAAGTFGKQYRQVIISASVTEIESGTFAKGTTLVCVPGSAAEAWAQANGFKTGVMTWTLRYETGFKLTPDPTELPGGSTLPLPIITRTGYTFGGWYWDAEGTEAVEQSAVMPQQDTTLYAGWTVSDDAAAQMADALQWTLDPATDTISITAYTGTATVLDIPAELHGKTVAAVEDYAFAYNPTLTEVRLPNTVTVIGARAFFAMHALAEVVLPTALKAIPDEAFTDCIALANISLPAGLEAIGAKAFKNTGLTALTLPASLKSIHATALTDCAALTEITVTTGNRYYESRDGVLFDTADGVLVKYPAAKPNSSYAVENTWSVGAWAFDGAQNLTEITLSGDVWSLGEGAFAGCGKLTAMPELNSMITIIPDRCFYGCSGLSEAVIPDTVKKIGALTFAGTSLTDLSIPQSVTQIGVEAFGTNVILHGERGSYAYAWAKENNRVFIPNGAAAIESIAIEQESLTMKRGERAALLVTVEPSNSDPDFLTFYSSAAGIASVDEDGVIHAVGGGDAVIFATAPGGISASCRVSVEVDVETITLNAEAISLIVGDTEQLRESFTPLRVTDRSIVWTSSNEETVTVDQKGFVTAVGDGEAVIRATAHNGLFAECKVSAYSHLTSFTIDGDSVVNAEVGGTVQLHHRFEPENLFSSEVRYTSSNEAVVTVNETGLLSFQAPGASIITAIPQADETKEVKILAFCGLNSKLTLPAALSVIEEEAFAETAAQYVYIPSSVTRIGSKAFSDSEALWVAEFESGNAQIAGDAFDGCENLIVLAPVGSKAAAWATAKGIPVMALGNAS